MITVNRTKLVFYYKYAEVRGATTSTKWERWEKESNANSQAGGKELRLGVVNEGEGSSNADQGWLLRGG